MLLEIKNLKTYFKTEQGLNRAVDGVDLNIYCGEILGVVGESGCGKSVTALSIMRLIEYPPGRIVSGEINYKEKDLVKLNEAEIRKIRGNDISMIFQEPMTSLNPVYTIGHQISEAILSHKKISKKEAIDRSIDMLRKVEIPLPEKRVYDYPHQLSGGMRQRVMIAMALSCNPNLLIADEPTTALDVTIQAQILKLITTLKKNSNMSIMFITHDLGVIAKISDRVTVMYAGKIVEYADVKELFSKPTHPYTWGLMKSMPKLNEETDRLHTIPGVVPSSIILQKGCRFHNRCLLADEVCRNEEPEMEEIEKGHGVRCFHYEKMNKVRQLSNTKQYDNLLLNKY